jgi:two-component system, chemotaxis family, chemotaxis protein CheY
MAWNILIVDDSSLTRKIVRRVIEMTQLDVDQFLDAENGAEALKILEQSSVDLVLSDLNMPEMSGVEMVHRMKSAQATKSIPVVIISTESKTVRIRELLAEGVKDYLHKPFTPEKFKDLIQALCKAPEHKTDKLSTEALRKALETMAFLTVVPVDDDMVVPQKTVMAEIGFSGRYNGAIQILASLDFCRILAENIGAIENADDRIACDALKELSNVTCGLFLPKVVTSTADTFDVTVPTIKSCDDSSQWSEFVADKDSCVLNVEGHAVAMRLMVNDTEAVKNN